MKTIERIITSILPSDEEAKMALYGLLTFLGFFGIALAILN